MSKYVEDALGPLKLDMLCKIAQLRKAIKDEPNIGKAEEDRILLIAYKNMIGVIDEVIEASKSIQLISKQCLHPSSVMLK